jgi:hypothetical protein
MATAEDVQLVDARKAASLLDVSTRTLDKLIARGVIVPVQLVPPVFDLSTQSSKSRGSTKRRRRTRTIRSRPSRISRRRVRLETLARSRA